MTDINKVSDISELIDLIQELDISYSFFSSPVETKFLFRGIDDITYKLLPSIFRKVNNQVDTLEINNNKYTAYTSELNILRCFISEAVAYINDDPSQNLYKWAQYAQHYGVPTRFLDWTSNPLVALYFACKNNKDKDAALWIMNINNYRYFLKDKTKDFQTEKSKNNLTINETINKLIHGENAVEYPILYKPYYTDLRMSAQSSFFMVWGCKEEPLESFFTNENFIKYEKHEINKEYSFGDEQLHHVLYKAFIFANSKQSLLRQLDLCGINEKTLFPGLDGIGRYIELKHRFDYDELLKNI